MDETLIFVYKADSGLLNTLADISHKLFSPQTYECRLCDLTHGVFQMHRPWREFVQGLPLACEFLHRDEFYRRYPADRQDLPVVLMAGPGGLKTLLSAKELQDMDSLAQLQARILEKLP